ncbi:putative membrane protein [Murinocardiopsis flavida]|uniref:Putative membrane protein n=1 Tax=Murinocardiopsis flavida TaxID=645275 RepID=A0A2P8D926_9ACTN|nr:DUF2306 domain-containing protein [Murinocardiopsis flavida]PSK93724.1 putative membrane protein [Murinocardiopsis flavida]
MSPASSPTSRRVWWGAWGVFAASAVGIALFSVAPYLTGDPSQSKIPIDPEAGLHFFYVTAHALPGSLLLLLGPAQFVPALRSRYPKVHRVVGRVYMVSVVLAAVAAVLSATFSMSGISAQVAFYLLAAAWVYSLVKAFLAIRRGQVRLHRVWMIRNYALSFAAVLLRAFLGIGLAVRAQFAWPEFADIYTTAVWASILVSAGVAEWFIVQRTLAPRDRPRPGAGSRPAAPAGTGR